MESSHIVGLAAVICALGGPFLVGIAYVVAQAWQDARNHEINVELKHRLVDAGMSADEIERVVNAGKAEEALQTREAYGNAGDREGYTVNQTIH